MTFIKVRSLWRVALFHSHLMVKLCVAFVWLSLAISTHNQQNSMLLNSQGRVQLTTPCSSSPSSSSRAQGRAQWDCDNLYGYPESGIAASEPCRHLFHWNEDSGPEYFFYPAANHCQMSILFPKLRRMMWHGESKDLSIYPGNISVLCSELEIDLSYFHSTNIHWASYLHKVSCWVE